MNSEDVIKAQAEALEVLADKQMEMIRNQEVQLALRDVKSPASKRTVFRIGFMFFMLECFQNSILLVQLGKLLMWRYALEDVDALWQPLADVAIEHGCNIVRIDNVAEVQKALDKQGRIVAKLSSDLKEEVEAQVLGASSPMGWNLVKFKEGSGVFNNPMVPIQAKDVRLLEHQFAQKGRDESSARAAMAKKTRDAGFDGRRNDSSRGKPEGSGVGHQVGAAAGDLPDQG